MPKTIRSLVNKKYLKLVLWVLMHSFRPASLPDSKARYEGQFGLDEYEKPIVKSLQKFLKGQVKGLRSFRHAQWVAGSHEGIAEFMTWMVQNGYTQVLTLPGEYEGFMETAIPRGLNHIETTDLSLSNPKAVWFISNPNGRDGNFVNEDLYRKIVQQGGRVFVDLSYLSTAEARAIDVSHKNIIGVAYSFSKPFGAFYGRLGVIYTRVPIPSLFGNRWFKSIFAIILAKKIVEKINWQKYCRKMKRTQAKIVKDMRKRYGLPFLASDAFLIAYLRPEDLTESQREEFKYFARGIGDSLVYRFNLAPQFSARDPYWTDRL